MTVPVPVGMSAAAIVAALRSGTASATDVIDAALRVIHEHNGALNAFTVVTEARARSRAAAIDRARAHGAAPGPLAGVPFGVKAMIDVAGVTTTAGSAAYARAAPATHDAAVVQALEAAGGVCVGVLNMDEFGMGGTTENTYFGPTCNPHDPTRTAGGSSGGSAAAVASCMVPIALGGDALGSVRLPASLCGVYGLRPTRGTVSNEGLLGARGSISTLGPLARTVADVRLCHNVLRMRTPCDPSTETHAAANALRLGIATGYFSEAMGAEARDALDRVRTALAISKSVDFPEPRLARAAAILINASESASDKLPLLRTHPEQFDAKTRDRFLAHALLPAQWYLQAQRLREWHIRQVRRMFEDVDVVLMPATPCVAPLLHSPTINIDGIDQPTGPALGWFTQPLAGTDCPALTVPVLRADSLPIGVQLFAPWGRERWLFDVAARLELMGVAGAHVATRLS